ncbi:MAG TPA: VWA domain-containing protein [Candidatus Acidoferrum sp.]|jgi:VWFA-related protein|nr:VWA domain-containing protein [Candidatus Acidoferrum sp.]
MSPRLLYRNPFCRCIFWFALSIFLPLFLQPAHGQDSTPASAPEKPPAASPQESAPKPKADAGSEISQMDSAATFKVRVNLVQVRVIVRDPSGKPVENLTREDFVLYDQGKPQTISNFSVETTQTRLQRAAAVAKTQEDASTTGDSGGNKGPVLPERFVALVFDDTHLSLQDASFARTQADRFLDSTSPTDRLAIYTTSGQNTLEFTADKAVLHRAILGIVPRPLMPQALGAECPEVTHYMADQIENKHDPQAQAVAIEETIQCQFNGDESKQSQALAIVQAAVFRALSAGDTENEFTYRHLEDVLRRLSSVPGERIMLLVSPGFLLTTQYLDESGVIDRANRANVVINTLDARGLYTPDVLGDISRPSSDSIRTAGFKTMYRVASQNENQYVLGDLAYGTGGTFFHNSNDLQGGLRLAGLAPEVSYVLAFSPQNRKMDGQYHLLRVALAKKSKYSIQARRGYYAPRKVDDPLELARQEIQEAIYSQEEINELPLDLQTQYFKNDPEGVRLSVVSRLEVKNMHFRKTEGRSLDDLTLATAIFDENGNFITGGEKTVQMRLKDTTYERLAHTGLTVKSSFAVKPGRYLVRQVVRDSEGSQMAARNGAVEIPF